MRCQLCTQNTGAGLVRGYWVCLKCSQYGGAQIERRMFFIRTGRVKPPTNAEKLERRLGELEAIRKESRD